MVMWQLFQLPCAHGAPLAHSAAPALLPQAHPAKSEQRYLAISAFLCPRAGQAAQHPQGAVPSPLAAAAAAPAPLVFVVVAASDASVELLWADVAAMHGVLGSGRRERQWRQAGTLGHHAFPVLCATHCCLEVPGPAGSSAQRRHIVFSGTTDGAVAAWDVTAAAAAAAADTEAVSRQPEQQQQQHTVMEPSLMLAEAHQSGVNCMAAVPAGRQTLPAVRWLLCRLHPRPTADL